jgi:hypothetical protein
MLLFDAPHGERILPGLPLLAVEPAFEIDIIFKHLKLKWEA